MISVESWSFNISLYGKYRGCNACQQNITFIALYRPFQITLMINKSCRRQRLELCYPMCQIKEISSLLGHIGSQINLVSFSDVISQSLFDKVYWSWSNHKSVQFQVGSDMINACFTWWSDRIPASKQ